MRQAGFAIALLVAAHLPAWSSDDVRERMLEERVRLLEQQLKQLEGRLERRDAAVPRRRDVRADSTRDPQRPVMPGRSPDTDPSQPPIVASATPDRPPHPPQPPSLGVGNPTDAPQETFVFRENSVTLPPWRFETSTAFGYVRGNGFLQFLLRLIF